MEVCGTDVLLAPAERIWHLFTDPRKLAEWTRTKQVEGPGEQIQITPIDAHSSRITLNAHLIFPPGWRGQLVEKILSRRIVTGPARALRRLKRAAEQDPILA